MHGLAEGCPSGYRPDQNNICQKSNFRENNYCPSGLCGVWPNTTPKTCEQKCTSFANTCKRTATWGLIPPAVLLEGACVAANIGAPACMISVNSLQGLSSAYLLSQCDKAVSLCYKKCKKENQCSTQ